MLEDVMRSALGSLQRHPALDGKFTVVATTHDAVIDADENDDGKLDDNPDTGAGSEPGDFTIAVYPVWSPPAPPPAPVLMVDEAACTELDLTTADAIVAHVLQQLSVS